MSTPLQIYSGTLREPVWVQVKTVTEDDGGGKETAWVDSFESYAHVISLGAADTWRNQRLEEKVTHELTMRYDADITTKTRIRFDARYFRVVALLDIELRGRRLILGCSETANKG